MTGHLALSLPIPGKRQVYTPLIMRGRTWEPFFGSRKSQQWLTWSLPICSHSLRSIYRWAISPLVVKKRPSFLKDLQLLWIYFLVCFCRQSKCKTLPGVGRKENSSFTEGLLPPSWTSGGQVAAINVIAMSICLVRLLNCVRSHRTGKKQSLLVTSSLENWSGFQVM